LTPAEALAVTGLLGAGFFLRRFALYWIPVFVHNDEISVLLEGRRFLGPHPPPLFGTGWYACPNLGFALNGLWLRIFGDNLLGGRLGSVVLGILSLAGAWWLARLLFGRRTALLTLAVLASWHWHLELSRSAHHYIQPVAFGTWSLAFLAAGLGRRKLGWFAISGAFAGIAVQTYYSARLVPLVMAAWCVVWLLERPAERRPVVAGLWTALLLMLATLAPLLPHYLEHPGDLNLRTRDVIVFSPESREHMESVMGERATLGNLLVYQCRRIGGFLFLGPDAAVQYGHEGPFLDPFLWAPFLGGLLVLMFRWRAPESWLPLLWIGGTLVAGGILTIDPPFSPRLSIMVTAVALVVAVGFEVVLSLRSRGATWRIVTTVGVTALLAASWAWNIQDYFVRFPAYRDGATRDRIVRLLDERPGTRSIVSCFRRPERFDYRAYAFVAPDARGCNAADLPLASGTGGIPPSPGLSGEGCRRLGERLVGLKAPILVVGPSARQLAGLYRRAGSGEWGILWDPWARRPLAWLWLDRPVPAAGSRDSGRSVDASAPVGERGVRPATVSRSAGPGSPRSHP